MKLNSTALALAILMGGASVAGIAARPSAKAVDKGNAVSLETMVPRSFGDWTEPVGRGRLTARWLALLDQARVALPALPLWLKGGPCMKTDLEASYEHTCRENRIF